MSGKRAPRGHAQPPVVIPHPVVSRDPNRSRFLLPGEYLSPGQLRGGMKGYGLTVFHGNTIEKFDVTVLGVVKKANNGRDLILVKLGGAPLSRVSDIIAGMSGSPVYINGKIIGAVAYGAAFTRESIGYVTPIEDMLEAWDPTLPQHADEDPAPPPTTPVALSTPVEVGGKHYAGVQIASRSAGRPQPGVLILRHLATKVTVSGVSGPRFTQVANMLAELGLEARQGGGAANDGSLKGSPLTPGGAIAMSLATGDIDITGIGTLTYRKGDRVVAFGHPFLGIGPLLAPMYTAYIHDIEPSYEESHKVGSPVSLVGTFSQDRPYSISGKVGPKPPMVPITVLVNDRAMGRSRTFHANLLKHPTLLPRLVNIAASTAIGEIHGQPGDVTATVTTRVETDGYGTILRTNKVQDNAAIESVAGEDLKNALAMLTGNSYGRVGIRSVRMAVDITPGKQTATVERLFLKQSRYEPGDTVEVGVVLKPYKQPEQIRTMHITLPANMPVGTHMLTVQGGPTGFGQTGLLAAFLGRSPDYSGTTNIEQMIRRYNERERNDALVARINLPTSSLLVKGEKLEGLPPNIEAAMRVSAARSTGARMERDEEKVVEQTDWVLSGVQSLPIRVARKGQPDVPSLPAPPSTPSDPPTNSASPSPTGNGGNLAAQSTMEEDDVRSPEDMSARMSAPPPSGKTAPPSTTEMRTTEPIATPATPPATGTEGANLSPNSSPATPTAVNMVGRQPGVWRQAGVNDFRNGVRTGIALTSQGTLRLAAELAKVAESAEPYFWCAVPDGAGGVFAGSGDNGRIYHVTADGKCALFGATGELEVHALVRTADGTLYAGTSPHGRVFRVTPEGKVERLLQANAKFILGLTLSKNGDILYVAAGGPEARVYAVPIASKGEATEFYHGDETNITALTTAPDGSLYAGTSPNGLVLRLTSPAGEFLSHPEVIYDATESTISGLVVDANGVVFAATAPRGALYRIAPGAAPRALLDRAPANMLNGLVLAGDGLLYTASGSSVLAIHPETGVMRTVEAPTDIQVMNLSQDKDGRLWAATGGVGGIYTLPASSEAKEGAYTSAVFDAHAVAQWGTLRFRAEIPSGDAVAIQTRSGNTSLPDATWSDWSAAIHAIAGEHISSPAARYLQYRVTLTGSAADAVALQSVEAFYLPPNQAPQVTLQSPRGGEVWHGSHPVRWSATDPDRDTLSYEILVSSDGGKTWQKASTPGRPSPTSNPLTSKVIAAAPPPTTNGDNSNSAAALAAIQAELDKHPEMSPEVRARILADAPKQMQVKGGKPTETGGATRDTTLNWDTSRLPDGIYLLKVVATDRPSNPTGALTTEVISAPFQVVNRPPGLSLVDKGTQIQGDRTVRLQGVAMHVSAAVRAVQFKVDNGEWQSATADDGIFDSQLEPFTITTAALTPGQHTIEVQAIDEAGNATTQKTTVSVNQ